MNKLITILALGVLSVESFAQNNQVFKSDFGTKEEFQKWTVIDHNKDGVTWDFKDVTSDNNAAWYGYSYSEKADDWLISPAITIAQAGYYKLSFLYQGSSSGEKMEVFYGTSNTVEGMVNSIQDLGVFSTNSKFVPSTNLIKLNPGTYYLGFYAKSDPNKFRIFLDDIVLTKETSGVDLGITEFLSPVSNTNLNKEEVIVTIKNFGYEAASNIPVGYSINGGTPVVETFNGTLAAGATTNYTFKAKADLSTPKGVYTLKSWTDYSDESISTNDTCAVKVRHLSVATVPYFMGFEENEETDLISLFNLNNDTGSWSVTKDDGFWSSFSYEGTCSMVYDYDRTNAGNDWFILEPIQMKAGYYALKFMYTTASDHKERLGVYYGTENDPAKLTHKVVEYNPFVAKQYAESANVMHIEQDGVYYFGFKAFSDANENVICIDNISIQEISETVADVEVKQINNPVEYVRTQSLKDVTYTLVNNSISDAKNCRLLVSIDGRQILSEAINLTAQQVINGRVKDALKDLAVGTHTLKVEISFADDLKPVNNVMEQSFKVVGEPDLFWGFEDEKIPGNFSVFAKDNGTIHSSLSDMFPSNSVWSLVEINSSEEFGRWMIISSSFLTGASQADRWCVLPKLDVQSEEACMIWSACSMDERFLEDYDIMVSETDNKVESFKSVYSVKKELDGTRIGSRGIDLGKYKGKSIYVAFRHLTKDGFILAFDNIGIYNINGSGSSISNMENPTSFVWCNSDNLYVNGDTATCIQVYNLAGNLLVQNQNQNQISISTLEKGMYMVVVEIAGGSQTFKFVKK